MPRRGRWRDGDGKFPSKSSQVALNGTTYATLVPAPPEDVSYRVTRVYGQNTTANPRTLTLAFNNGGARSIVWQSVAAAQDTCFTQSAVGTEIFELGIILEQGESLDMKLEDTGTDKIVAAYEVAES